MTKSDPVDKFTHHFRMQCQTIADLSSAGGSSAELAMHRKILYVTLLDALAKARFHNLRLSNHDRCIKLFEEHCDWEEGALVSAPILRERLDATVSSPLQQHLDQVLGTQDPQKPNGVSLSAFDEPVPNLLRHAQGAECKEVKRCQHYELTYRYRNYIVHEFRTPGYAMECLADGADPIYHAFLNDPTWRLVYPAAFLHRLCENALESLRDWFKTNSVNPYDSVADSSAW